MSNHCKFIPQPMATLISMIEGDPAEPVCYGLSSHLSPAPVASLHYNAVPKTMLEMMGCFDNLIAEAVAQKASGLHTLQ
ncbi:hypothetical protein D3C85_1564530 [compost metagenome]